MDLPKKKNIMVGNNLYYNNDVLVSYGSWFAQPPFCDYRLL
jgi:hypothetical protein